MSTKLTRAGLSSLRAQAATRSAFLSSTIGRTTAARTLATSARSADAYRPATRSVATSTRVQHPQVQPRPLAAAANLPPTPLRVPSPPTKADQPHPIWQYDAESRGWLRLPSPAERTQFMQSEVEDGCLDFAVRFDFAVNQPVTREQLVQAWADTLYRHPIVGVEKHGDFTNGVWYYPDYANPDTRKAWIQDTFVYLPAGGKEAVQQAIDAQLSQRFGHKCSLHMTIAANGNNTFTVCMHCRHASYDIQGVSTVFLGFEDALSDVLNNKLPQRHWGTEIPRLPIPTEQAVQDDIGTFSPDQVEEANKSVKEQMAQVAQPHFNLPYAEQPNWAAVPTGSNHRANVVLSPDQTSSLIKAVKKSKLSVTPFIIACAMHTLKKYSPPADKHVFLNVVNRRRWLQEHNRMPHTNEKWPFFGNSVQILHAPDRGEDVVSLARDVYQRQWADLLPEKPVPLWGLNLAQKMYEDSLVPFNPAHPPEYRSGAIYVSSPGPLDKGPGAPLASTRKDGNVVIDNVDFGANIRMTSGHSLLHIWTVGGKLELQLTIPKWYCPETAQAWMNDTKKLLIDLSALINDAPEPKL